MNFLEWITKNLLKIIPPRLSHEKYMIKHLSYNSYLIFSVHIGDPMPPQKPFIPKLHASKPMDPWILWPNMHVIPNKQLEMVCHSEKYLKKSISITVKSKIYICCLSSWGLWSYNTPTNLALWTKKTQVRLHHLQKTAKLLWFGQKSGWHPLLSLGLGHLWAWRFSCRRVGISRWITKGARVYWEFNNWHVECFWSVRFIISLGEMKLDTTCSMQLW